MIETQNIILKIYTSNFLIYKLLLSLLVVMYCIKNWIKFFRKQTAFLFHFETWNNSILLALTRFYLLYHSLSFVVTRCHLLSLAVIRCLSLALSVPLVVISCNCHCTTRFSLAVTRCIPPICLFINDQKALVFKIINPYINFTKSFV